MSKGPFVFSPSSRRTAASGSCACFWSKDSTTLGKRWDQVLAEHKGYVAQLSATAESGSARMVVASLRVPADQLDVCLAELRTLRRHNSGKKTPFSTPTLASI